jgi:2-polyprenyl-3-methyl-5-hydroxy-6-metoxy-1,4-benzoquinol methylase
LNDSYHERDFRSGSRPGIVEPADGETVPMTKSTADLTVDACPLCGCRSAGAVESIPYASIWSELERQLGLATPAELRRRFTPTRDALLFACSTCGLEYFSPHNQGDAAFYAFLTSAEAGYYTNRRWEYSVVEKLLHSGDSLLDIGCGDGAFLKQVARRVGRAVGVDQNPEGIRDLAEAGIDARCTDLEVFAAENAASFNVVCAFQLLEHLPRVDAFAAAARRCVAPGGLLLVSVPNNDRLRLNPLDPLDCPPHHVSRWRPAQLREFARTFQFDLVDVICERRRPSAMPSLLGSLARRTSTLRHRGAATSADAHGEGSEPRARSHRPMLGIRHLRNLMLGHTMLLIACRPA